MRVRPAVESETPSSLFERLKALLRSRDSSGPTAAPKVAKADIEIPEDVLVTLGAIQHAYPEWLGVKSELWDDPGGFLEKKVPSLKDKIRKQHWIEDAIGALAVYREPFSRVSEGIKILH